MARNASERKHHQRNRNKSSIARSYLCEWLEPRKYLVVLHAGDTFEYFPGGSAGHFERVIVTGDTGTVELFGTHINTSTGQQTLDTMHGVIIAGPDDTNPTFGIEFGTQIGGGLPPQASTGTSGGSTANGPVFADSLYAMYVSQGDVTTHIAVAEVPNLTVPGPRNMEPYGASSYSLQVVLNNGVRPPLQPPGGIGGALLGAVTPAIQGNGGGNVGGFPITAAFPVPADAQTLPPTVTSISPGLVVAQGVNLGEFLFGGMIMGSVNIQGSVDLFYAGWIITGAADGAVTANFNASATPVNFNVDGDLRYLVSAATIGADSVPNTLPSLLVPNYYTGFSLRVGGRLGSIETPGSVFGTVDVVGSPTAPSISGRQITQLANNILVGTNSTAWNNADFGEASFVNNDTFNTPQFLGPIDPQNDVVVNGAIQALSTSNEHSANYYGLPLMAGQTITVQLTQPFDAPTFIEGLNYGWGMSLGTGPGVAGGIGGGGPDVLQEVFSTGTPLNVGIFDPDGRLVATDYGRVDLAETMGQPFQYTTKIPGIYRIAVATNSTNNTFTATTRDLIGEDLYQLTINNVGSLSLGGISAGQNIVDTLADTTIAGTTEQFFGFHVENGDLGALFDATGEVLSGDIGPLTSAATGLTNGPAFSGGNFSIGVDNGNLRAVEASSIGLSISNTSTTASGISQTSITYDYISGALVPKGSVGMLKATSTANSNGIAGTGVLLWNFFVTSPGEELDSQQAAFVGIGGDYQLVEAGNFFAGDLVAKGNIGSIIAGQIDSTVPSYFQVNAADDPSRHGVIDSIDVSGNFGTLSLGGPAITTGPNGNVRYIHVGTNALAASAFPFPGSGVTATATGQIFRDAFFGGGVPEYTLYQPGETADITDDSGSVVHLTPESPADSLSVITYPIRGSGGSVIVQVMVINLANPALTEGLNIVTSGGGSAEIGDIVLSGNGIPVTVPGTFTTAASSKNTTNPAIPNPPIVGIGTNPIDINISGSAKTDIYSIDGVPVNASNDGSIAANTAQISTIINTTGGELLNANVRSIGSITTTGSIGLGLEQNTACQVVGLVRHPLTEDGGSGAPWDYPFLLPTNMVRILGDVVSIQAKLGIGNLYAGVINGASDGVPATLKPTTSVPGPVATPLSPAAALPAGTPFAAGTNGAVGSITGAILGPIVTAGSVNTITTNNIAFNGTGAVGFAGIFSSAQIGNVTINGIDRGEIVAASGALGTAGTTSIPLAAIGNVTINGVLDGGSIATYARFDFDERRVNGVVGAVVPVSPVSKPTLNIGAIHVTGNGGIIGALIDGSQIGQVTVAPTGFGIFDTLVTMVGNGTVAGINAGGYGIRGGFIEGGATVGSIVAGGNGSNVPVGNFPAIVRQSETGAAFDPATGLRLNYLNDIDTYLGTSALAQQINGVTDTGIIEDLTVRGSREVDNVSAWSVRGRVLPVNTTTSTLDLVLSEAAITTFNIPNAIFVANVSGPINGWTVVTGRTGKFNFGGDAQDLTLTVAGPITNIVFNSSLLGSSAINATGASGSIKSITIKGNFTGQITATKAIGKINILGSMSGTIHGATLGGLKLSGGLGSGSLKIQGNVSAIQITGNLSAPGNTLTINGTLGRLQVSGNLDTNVSVAGNLNQLTIGGSILAANTISVTRTINLLKVAKDVQAGAMVTAHIIKKKIIGGQLLGTITTA